MDCHPNSLDSRKKGQLQSAQMGSSRTVTNASSELGMLALFLLVMLFSDLSEEEAACLAQLELDVWPWVFAGGGE